MMIDKNKSSIKSIGTREWYDFVGQYADTLPGMYMGGQDASPVLLDMCHLTATSHIPGVVCGGGNTLGLPLI
jgi:hypothetical protein